MSAENLLYFKFISNIILNGCWAKLSSSARTLYPVLLSFSDRNFKPVWPGTRRLLELTGFKHKETISKARKELSTFGLITYTLGTGRKNTIYQFCFNLELQSGAGADANSTHGSDYLSSRVLPQSDGGAESGLGYGVGSSSPPYNQIHISIDNYLGSNKNETKYKKFKEETNKENTKNFKSEFGDWKEIKKELSKKISPQSLDLICKAFIMQKNNVYIFKDNLPDYLKTHLRRVCNVLFETFESAKINKENIKINETDKGRLLKIK